MGVVVSRVGGLGLGKVAGRGHVRLDGAVGARGFEGEGRMSKPRERHPKSMYFVTRRVHGGEYRMRPDDEVTNAIGYILALGCARHGVKVATFCAMSNHYHATVYDPLGQLAAWECFVNSRLASYLNARHGRTSHVLDASEGNAIEVQGAVFVSKSAYTEANPTKAGLVYDPKAWPGLLIGLRDLRTGRPRVFHRPDDYFDPEGLLPETVELVAEPPPHWKRPEFCRRLAGELKASLAQHRAALAAAGRKWVGIEAVRAASPFTMPRHTLPANVGRAAMPRPRLIGTTEGETKSMLERYEAFLERYAAALASWRKGVFDIVFPEGTWRLWRSFGARRGPAGSPGERWTRPVAAPS